VAGFAVGINRVFAASTRGYFGAYIIYIKSKVNLFRMLAGMLRDYNKKEGKT
jgi:hypothetical protein